jgi:tricarballylate dehydrogenase
MAADAFDVVIVGCGAAGMSTAVSFAETAAANGTQARIAILERSSEAERGGASRWTNAGMRVDDAFTLDPKWIGELQAVSQGHADLEYARAFEKAVDETGRFLVEHGVEFIHTRRRLGYGDLSFASPDGGGLAIIDSLANSLCAHPGVQFFYQTEAVALSLDATGEVQGVRVRSIDGRMRVLHAPAVMLACGGFEANYEMLSRYLGPNANRLKKLAPGTRFNTGDGIRMAIEIGAATAGQFDRAHLELIDVRTDRPDATIVAHNFCIAVDSDAKRFYDEGEEILLNSFEQIAWATWTRTAQNTAYLVTDSAVMDDPKLATYFGTDVPLAKGETIGEVAMQLGLDPDALTRTVEEFNAACNDRQWNPHSYDGKAAEGLEPPKSNWANPLRTAPFYGVPVAAAICFTYGGLKTDRLSRVLSNSGGPITGLYAAGEIVGLHYYAYPALTTVLRACTFGRIAGAHAATVAQHQESRAVGVGQPSGTAANPVCGVPDADVPITAQWRSTSRE